MIPYEFDFHVKNGTGMIFHAKLNDDFEHYDITFDNGKCQYAVKEVMEFLSKGQWREGIL